MSAVGKLSADEQGAFIPAHAVTASSCGRGIQRYFRCSSYEGRKEVPDELLKECVCRPCKQSTILLRKEPLMRKGVFIPDVSVKTIKNVPLEAIEALLAEGEMHDVEIPAWIPCSERLPNKESATYLICTDGGYMCSCRWTNDMYGLSSHEWSEWGWHIMDTPQYAKVVAWMELEPWKGTDDDSNNE